MKCPQNKEEKRKEDENRNILNLIKDYDLYSVLFLKLRNVKWMIFIIGRDCVRVGVSVCVRQSGPVQRNAKTYTAGSARKPTTAKPYIHTTKSIRTDAASANGLMKIKNKFHKISDKSPGRRWPHNHNRQQT